MNVLIVARTRMREGMRCIGGITRKCQPLRLMTADGSYQSTSCPFHVGDVWELQYRAMDTVRPPHVENVCVDMDNVRRLRRHSHLQRLLRNYATTCCGSIDRLFRGLLQFTTKGSGYISHRTGVPDGSTAFWIPDRDLERTDDGKHYMYNRGRRLVYVGEPEPVPVIPAGTVVRVSLATWWKPPDSDLKEERCYLQLSGWYT